MAGAANRLIVFIRDYRGEIGKFICFVGSAVIDPTGAAITALKTALNALTKGRVVAVSITTNAVIESANLAVDTGGHDDIDDRLRFHLVDEDGQYHRPECPSPSMDNFDPAEPTILKSPTAVPPPPYAALATALQDHCRAKSGVELTLVRVDYYRRKGDIA